MATQQTSPALTIAPGARRRAIVSSVIGNGLEWFDFGIFSSFSVIISRLMFPPQSGPAMLMVAFASFGIAFVVRPFGGRPAAQQRHLVASGRQAGGQLVDQHLGSPGQPVGEIPPRDEQDLAGGFGGSVRAGRSLGLEPRAVVGTA